MSRWGLLMVLAAATGCSGSGGDSSCSGAAAVKLSDLQTSIFTPSCAVGACHSGPMPAGSMDLESGQTYAATVNVKSVYDGAVDRVDPGNAASSELYLQVEQGLMPQTGGPLTAAQQKQIHDWICDGAPND